MVDLTVVSRLVAQVVEALLVAHLYRPAGGAGEQPSGHSHVDPREGDSKTTRSTQAESSQGTSDPGLTTLPLANWQIRPAKLS